MSDLLPVVSGCSLGGFGAASFSSVTRQPAERNLNYIADLMEIIEL
ncbi:MAG: hypothetical protein ACTHLY_02330 [Pseudolabrys sp.]